MVSDWLPRQRHHPRVATRCIPYQTCGPKRTRSFEEELERSLVRGYRDTFINDFVVYISPLLRRECLCQPSLNQRLAPLILVLARFRILGFV